MVNFYFVIDFELLASTTLVLNLVFLSLRLVSQPTALESLVAPILPIYKVGEEKMVSCLSKSRIWNWFVKSISCCDSHYQPTTPCHYRILWRTTKIVKITKNKTKGNSPSKPSLKIFHIKKWLMSYILRIYTLLLKTGNEIYEVHTISFQTFFAWAFKIVIDSWKFTILLLYILWDDWPIFMISGSNQQLQQEL